MKLPYDETKPESIEEYAKKLIGKTFYDVIIDYFYDDEKILNKRNYYNNPKGKGSLGNLLEKYYFMYKPNNNSRADFEKANTELKVTPYEKNKNNKIIAGERLVITMIPNSEPIEPNFEKSHLLNKLKLILLILYYRDRSIERVDYKINYVKLFSIISEICKKDYEIIKKDYEIITNKIINGKAHELSESDTRYLGACTKGTNAKKILKKQYYNDKIPAKRRAFALKQSYMTHVINEYIMENVQTYDSIIDNKKIDPKNFESEIINIINNNKGKTEYELYKEFDVKMAKNRNSTLVNRMLGVKTKNSIEFNKANIEIKTIRVKKNGDPKESMSFPTFEIKKLIKENFENSELCNLFEEKRFLFVVFRENLEGKFELKGGKFWNMPINELETIGKTEWEKYKREFKNEIKFEIKRFNNGKVKVLNSLSKEKENKIFHVRPHAKKSAYIIKGIKYGNGNKKDMDTLPNGDMMTKQCFWLNKEYVKKIIVDIK